MQQKVKQKSKRSWITRYRFCLVLLLLVVLLLMGWYCLTSYRQTTTPKEGTLVDSVKMYERQA